MTEKDANKIFEFIDVRYKDILDIPRLQIDKGKITTFVGESGGGKTTVLKMLNKMISPSTGSIIFEGERLENLDSVQHRRKVTMLSQNPVIFEGSVRENLIIGLKYQERAIPKDEVLIEVLNRIKLKKDLEDSAANLSGGERQRLALGRVLLLDSPVYLMDEPSSALDGKTEDLIIDMVTEMVRRRKKTLVMVTHSDEIARKYSDTIVRIEGGRCMKEDAK